MTVGCPYCGKRYTVTNDPESWECPRCAKPRKSTQKEAKK